MRQLSWKYLLLVVWGLLSLLSVVLLVSSQRQSQKDIRQVFEGRVQLAARLTETYTGDLLKQERRVARRELSRASVGARDMANVTNLFGYEAAVLLDAHGRAVQVVPEKSSLVGRDLTTKYAHLRAAAAGRTAISDVIPSAAKGVPIVAFATPFASAHGRRVFSGAFDVRTTPIGAYLRQATVLKGARVYLLDSAGVIVASNRRAEIGLTTLAQADRDLAGGLSRSPAGRTDRDYQYASQPVAHLPWRLVISVPRKQVFKAIQGSRRYVAWGLWLAAVLGGLASSLLMGYLITSRTKLREANADLDLLARTDALTTLANRRQIQAALEEATANADRHDHALSVLMIDVDRFKEINDRYGHNAGDDVLRFVAAVIRDSLRTGDAIGRWGGEEFLAVLPSTDRRGAEIAADRIRQAVSTAAVVIRNELVPISVSIGAAARTNDHTNVLVAEADTAMYAAKAAGRNTVRVAR